MKNTIKNVIFSLTIVAGILGFIPSSHACSNGNCSSYVWNTYGVCTEVASDGVTYIGTVDNSYCEHSQGFVYNWDTYGVCLEWEPDGVTPVQQPAYGSFGSGVRQVDKSNCGENCGVLQHR